MKRSVDIFHRSFGFSQIIEQYADDIVLHENILLSTLGK